MANKYLDDTGLAHFKGKNDSTYAGSLSLSNNNSLTLKTKAGGTLSTVTIGSATSGGANPGLMTGSQAAKLADVSSGAQVNVIESVKVNNTALTITNKAVNIDLSNYALKSDISQMSEFKGVVSAWANLPASGQSAGDMYIVTSADATHNLPANGNVIWNGSEWDVMGEMFAITRIDEADDIDPLFT